MAKKAFKRTRLAAPPPCSKPEPGLPDAASRQWKINLSLLVCVWSRAIPPRPARKGAASRWLAAALAMDRVVFIVQRFCKIT
jgi:hypothetical protein